MMKWHATVLYIFMWLSPTEHFRTQELSLLPPLPMPTPSTPAPKGTKNIPNSISDFFGQMKTEDFGATVTSEATDDVLFLESSSEETTLPQTDDSEPPDRRYPAWHAGLPRKMEVFPLPLQGSDHELQFNVSWIPSLTAPARDYSLEVRSMTDTIDCQTPMTPMCYEYNIPGWLIPAFSTTVAGSCAVRPGCAYTVKLISHPWDGHTSANLHVELDECVAGVCSCAHSPRLPAPAVFTETVTIKGEMFTNISWTLPKPTYPQRLPSAKLGKHSYIVSLGKRMVSDARWYANTITRHVDADGLISEGDGLHWLLLPLSERSVEQAGESKQKRPRILPNVAMLARVNVVDDRGCVGPAGNATAFDPTVKSSKFSFGTYVILAALGGAWVMGAVFALSARLVKRVLKAFRPAPVSAPLGPLRGRPAWFPMQLRT